MATKTTPARDRAENRLAEIRARIAELQAEHERVCAAPVPLAVAAERAKAAVAAHAARRASMAPWLLAPGREPQRIPVDLGRSDVVSGSDVTALLAALVPDALEALLIDDARRALAERGEPGMTESDRAARLAEIAEEILELELAEESIIRALEAQGIGLARRGDADPRVVLGLEPGRAPSEAA